MSKPRFPLSVSREFVYRAFIRDTGEILECDDLKSLYHHALCNLRCEVGKCGFDNNEPYRNCSAVLEFGYRTDYEIRKGYYYSEWESLKTFGFLFVSPYMVSFENYESNKECVTYRRADN